jgi:hypothetical protein
VENEAARHAVASQKLDEVAVRDDGAVERPKNEKPPNDTLRMAHGHGFRLQCTSNEVTGDEEQWHTEAPFHDDILWNLDSKTCTVRALQNCFFTA